MCCRTGSRRSSSDRPAFARTAVRPPATVVRVRKPSLCRAGDLTGAYSRRINIRHRLVYDLHPEARTVRVLRMWTRDA
ncbi:MAG: type II toxin-antitoxin system mRNA interferase toxin, RelE/StbE family [Thermoanaerobaculia bacterium]